ncbi:hypothetical protein U1Q18_005789 [Sarracenia purpurea var. burkii]
MTEADHGRPERLPCVPVRRRRILRRGSFRTSVRRSSLFPSPVDVADLFRVGDLTADDPNGSPTVVCLDVVEDVPRYRSVCCDQCRIVGWNGNPMWAKHYHLIIKAYVVSISGYHKSCTGCGEFLHLSKPHPTSRSRLSPNPAAKIRDYTSSPTRSQGPTK